MVDTCPQEVSREVSTLQLHASFPAAGIDAVNDVLGQCHGDTERAMHMLEEIYGAGAYASPMQSPVCGNGPPGCLSPVRTAADAAAVPWSPQPAGPTHASSTPWSPTAASSAPIPAALFPAEAVPVKGNSVNMHDMFPVPAPRRDVGRTPARRNGFLKDEKGEGGAQNQAARTPGTNQLEDFPVIRASLMPKPAAPPTPVQPTAEIDKNMLPAIIDSLMPKPPAAAAAAVTPKPRASRLVGPPMLLQPAACDSNPRTPKHARAQTGEVAATILDLLSQPQQEQPLSSTRESEWDDASMGSRRGSAAEVEGTAHQTDQEHAVVPAADQTPEATEHAATLDFLQGMFGNMEPTLVADTAAHYQYNADATLKALMGMQNVMDRTDVLDSSSEASNVSAQSEANSAGQGAGNGVYATPGYLDGQPWDVSGVATDYTFQGLTLEQKCALIRKELPACSADEARSSLEACQGDVDAALAALSQVYDKKEEAPVKPEVQELAAFFPDADLATLTNVYEAAGDNIASAKQLLEDNGWQSTTPEAPNTDAMPLALAGSAGSEDGDGGGSLFRQPAEAAVRKPSVLPPQAPPNRPIKRRDVEKDRIYKENRANVAKFKDAMEKSYMGATAARKKHDTNLAQRLVEQAHYFRGKMKEAEAEAGHRVFHKMNANIENDFLVDLHGLHVDEAINKSEDTIMMLAKMPGRTNVRLITGRGNHSGAGGPKLLPALRRYLDYHQYEYQMQHDMGAIIVFVGGSDTAVGPYDPGPSRSQAPPGPQPRNLAAYLPKGWG